MNTASRPVTSILHTAAHAASSDQRQAMYQREDVPVWKKSSEQGDAPTADSAAE
jgi:hypothetical protein